jgi:acid phosphatase family membrane protein YuiD
MKLLTVNVNVRVFENRVLRRIFGPKRDEVTRGWKIGIMRSFITCALLQV